MYIYILSLFIFRLPRSFNPIFPTFFLTFLHYIPSFLSFSSYVFRPSIPSFHSFLASFLIFFLPTFLPLFRPSFIHLLLPSPPPSSTRPLKNCKAVEPPSCDPWLSSGYGSFLPFLPSFIPSFPASFVFLPSSPFFPLVLPSYVFPSFPSFLHVLRSFMFFLHFLPSL